MAVLAGLTAKRLAVAMWLIGSSCACATVMPRTVEEQTRASIERVRAVYPELQGEELRVAAFVEDGVFFASNFDLHGYAIHVNPRAFELGLAERVDALDGVIAHELAHTLDYESRDVLTLGLEYFFDEQAFERRTDLVAIRRGYGRGLLAYRIWQFRVLTPAQVREKKRIYYGPLEIALLLDAQARCPTSVDAMVVRPPRSAREIVRRCAKQPAR
jgi:hypothetical protein